MRVNKYLVDAGYCSRKEADRLMSEARVTINDRAVELGHRMETFDRVCVDGKPIVLKDTFNYIVLNKPSGIECTANPQIASNVVDYIKHSSRLFPVGRMDKKCEGLLIMTSDGRFNHKMLKRLKIMVSEYEISVDKPVSDELVDHLCEGIALRREGKVPCRVVQLSKRKLRLTVLEGYQRKIRRLCNQKGYRIVTTKRVQLGPVKLDNLKIGKYRNMTDLEKTDLGIM